MVEWKKYKLSDIGEIKTGKTPPSKCNGAFSSYGIPFVTPVDMKGQKWISKTERYITKNGLETVKNYLVPKNSISVSCIGSDMGKAVLLKKESVTNQQINTLVVDDKHNYEYIYYVLSLMQGYFKSISGGSATPILNKSDFSKIEIELPSLDMQTKLVEYVRYFDEKIELNTQTAQTLETIAQTIFKSWFVDFDPIHAKINAIETGEDPTLAAMQAISCKNPEELHRLQTENPQEYRELEKLANAFPCEIGEDGVPKGWEIKSLKDVCLKIQSGGTPKRKENSYWLNGTIPWISSGEVCNNKMLVKSKEFITQSGLENSSAKMIKKNSTLLAMYASPTAGKSSFCAIDATTNQAICALEPKPYFRYFNYLSIQDKEQYYANQASGAAQQNINKGIVESTPILVPNDLEIVRFLDVLLTPIFEKTAEILNTNEMLSKARDLLLPKLLKGEFQSE